MKKSILTACDEKLNFGNKMCHQYLYSKIMVHAPKFIKKGKQLSMALPFCTMINSLLLLLIV